MANEITRGRGGKNNTPNVQPLDLEPGDNTKYLTLAMTVMNLPPIDIADVNQVKSRINEYLNLCSVNDIKPTVKGFCNALKISRTTLFDWKRGKWRGDSHQAVIIEAYDLLEELWENYMQNGKINPVSGIFLGKNNFGYQDKQEYVVTPNVNEVEAVDAKIIEEKYAELPGE
jgi:hypothetical protein